MNERFSLLGLSLMCLRLLYKPSVALWCQARRMCLMLSVLLAMFLTCEVRGQSYATGDHVTVRWLAPSVVKAGEQEVIGFYFEVDPHWHVYWHNPGDSGAAPRFDIQANNVSVGDVLWPFPARLPIAHLTNLGYEGNVAYLLPVTANAGASEIELHVNLEWLVCKVDCIPGFGEMRLRIPVGSQTEWESDDLQLRDHFLARVPMPSSDSPWHPKELWVSNETQLSLSLVPNAKSKLNRSDPTVQVFPVAGDVVTAAEPSVAITDAGLIFSFNKVPGAALPQTTDFVLVAGDRAWQLQNVTLVNDEESLLANRQQQSFLWLLGAAFLGGVILNLMPCVFPVLSIKLFGLVQQGPSHRMREGLAYGAGVLCTFALLGGVLLALRAGGAAIGWGFQLQSPPVILTLIVLFWLMALSFSGVFEFGHRLVTLAGAHRGGAFVTGVMAVFVATPCTGPFMGAALGAAAVLPPVSALLLFLGLGAGLAAPLVVLCFNAGLLNRLPKPGPWMETLRQFLAFPLYATVIWLLWVLGRLVGDTGWLVGASLMLSFVVAIWFVSKVKWGVLGRAAIALAAIGAFVCSLNYLAIPDSNQNSTSEPSQWNRFDNKAIAQARAEGRAVFIDYTAAWCITCQVNKKLVLDTRAVQSLFKENDVYLVRADWTHRDDAITQALAKLGRNSVPVYAWYPPGSHTAQLLPQILSADSIESLFTARDDI